MNAPAEPRRILFVTADLGGGTGAHLVHMLGLWDPAKWTAELLCFGKRYNVPMPSCPVTFAPVGGPLNRFPLVQIRNLLLLRRAVKRLRPHVVHAYFFWPIMYCRILKRLGVIKHLVENREDMGFSWGKLEYAALKRGARVPDRVVCVADAVAGVVRGREGVADERVVTIRNGVAVMEGGGRREEAASSAPLIGMVSNLNRSIKGIEYFLHAVPKILEAVPTARFLILGGGRLRPRYEALAQQLGVAEAIEFAGHQQDIGRFYRAMDVSVLTSLSEGLSITLLESMAYGLPVVVTDVGGNPEVVVEGETGFVVPPKDVDAFVERVVTLLKDEDLRKRFGSAARARATSEFSMARVNDRYLKLYEDVLAVERHVEQKPEPVTAP